MRWFLKGIALCCVLMISSASIIARANEPGKKFQAWLKQAMQDNQVPAVSIAVIRDFKIDWVMSVGVANIKSEEPIKDTTLFQAGSLSKPITAVAALKAVEDGKINLDTDINSYLSLWKLPSSYLSDTDFVTLRELLSHSGGINVPGFLGYAKGQTLPTFLDVLNGSGHANSKAITLVGSPGETFEFSGGGYLIVQAALMDIYHQPFDEIMESVVFDPLGMTNSTFKQPLPSSKLSQIATPYRPDYLSVEGGPHTYVEEAAAGLWTTPFDLAKMIISLQSSLKGSPYQILAPESAKLMMEPEIDNMGLGFYVNIDKYGQPSRHGRYFMHRGQNEGYRSLLIARTTGGLGLVIMTNMSPDAQLLMKGQVDNNWDFINQIAKRIADMEGWY